MSTPKRIASFTILDSTGQNRASGYMLDDGRAFLPIDGEDDEYASLAQLCDLTGSRVIRIAPVAS